MSSLFYNKGECKIFWKRASSKSEKQEYKNNNIKITGSKVNQGAGNSVAKCGKDKRHRKNIIAAKQELQEKKKSIDTIRDRLNKIASQGERLELTEEIIEISRQLDVLILDYQRKSIEIQEMAEIKKWLF